MMIRSLRASLVAAFALFSAAQTVTTPRSTPQRAASTTISRARLQQVLGASTALRVVRASGVTDLSPSAAAVTVAPGEFVFRKMSDTARRVARPSPHSPSSGVVTYAMPYRWMTVDSAGVERVLMPYFVILGGGLSYDVATRTYRGVALVGVEDTLHEGADAVTL